MVENTLLEYVLDTDIPHLPLFYLLPQSNALNLHLLFTLAVHYFFYFENVNPLSLSLH